MKHRLPRLLAMMLLAAPSAMAQTLGIGIADAITSIDPHFLNSPTNKNAICNVFDGLTDTDSRVDIEPALAESWTLINDHTWEFKLRRNARFHDGTPFTATDAVASIARVPKLPNAPAPFTTYMRTITAMHVVDPHTVRMETDGLNPNLPAELAQVRMIKADLADSPTEDFNTGKAAIGTGPYRFVSYKPGATVELERSEFYWGKPGHWKQVTYRFITDGGARVAALLAGDVQVIDFVPSDAMADLRKNERLRLVTSEIGLRFLFLALDQSRTGPTPFVTGPNGETLPSNPLLDVRVRRALSLAINRPALMDRIMEGTATISAQVMPRGGFGNDPTIADPPYDPDQARKLLAEAGFPNGLRITIHSARGRWINDSRIVQAIAQMWQRIGVQTSVELQPWSSYISKVQRTEFSVMMGSVAAVTGEASQPLRGALGTRDPGRGFGGFNFGRYSNPDLDALLDQSQRTADDRARAALLWKAARIGVDQVGHIPLHLQRASWAMRRDIVYPGRSDDQTRLLAINPAP